MYKETWSRSHSLSVNLQSYNMLELEESLATIQSDATDGTELETETQTEGIFHTH